MATLKQCDRCGAVFPYKADANNAVCIGTTDLYSDFSFYPGDSNDLYPKCMDEFLEWLMKFKEN